MVVPKGWEKANIADIADIISGGTPRTSDPSFWGGDILWCTPTDITKSKVKYLKTTERKISSAGLQASSATLLPVGTILLCTRATIGDMSIAGRVISTNQGFKNLICHENTNNEYLYYALQPKKQDMIDNAIGTTFLEINKKALGSISICLPPLPEQTAIAESLSDVDELIVSLEKLIEKKKAIKQGTTQQLLTAKKRLSGFTGEWEKKSLKSLCYLITKQTGFDYTNEIKPSLLTRHDKGTIPFVQNKDFEGMKVNYLTDYFVPRIIADNYPNIIMDERCLLISISGRIGNVGTNKEQRVAMIGGAVGIAKFFDKSQIDWVVYYLLSDIGQKMIFSYEKAGAQHNLTVEDIRNFTIPMPTCAEQTAITAILTNMDAEIEALNMKLTKYRRIKQGMMQELLTGRIRLV